MNIDFFPIVDLILIPFVALFNHQRVFVSLSDYYKFTERTNSKLPVIDFTMSQTINSTSSSILTAAEIHAR